MWGPRVFETIQSLLERAPRKDAVVLSISVAVGAAVETVTVLVGGKSDSFGSGLVNFICQSALENSCEKVSLLLKMEGRSKLGRELSFDKKGEAGGSFFKNEEKSMLLNRWTLPHDSTPSGLVDSVCSVIAVLVVDLGLLWVCYLD
mmetsp:Transcript_85361/g.237544  ORF Transcript_85361/g.237544 Transcript_85361/m.237544 type:complete len:146 (-) Transcript_85361:108-545(-)